MQSGSSKLAYFPALTGIRTVASCMVFLHHFNPFKAAWFGSFIHDFVGEFHVGVTIFFVLSGFLICSRYYEDVSFQKAKIKTYLLNRFARIYPMYFIITLVSFLPFICHCIFSEHIGLFLLNLTFLRGFFDEYKFSGIPGGWSLTVEEMFYFLFPALILIAKKIKLIYQPALWIGMGLLLWLVFQNISFHGFFSTPKFLFEFTFFGRCIEFYTGMMLAMIFRAQVNRERSGNSRTSGGAAGIVLCISLLVINRRHTPDESGSFIFFETLINNAILPAAIALFFSGLLTEKSLVRKALESGPFTLLGKSSYVFYLIHNGFLFSLFYLTWHLNLPVIFILLQGISILLYFTAERPLNQLIRKLGRKAGQ